MTDGNTKRYRYRITVEGEGGEFAFIPLTPDEMRYWRRRGSDALQQHLRGWEDEDTTVPPELEIGTYYDVGDCAFGIDLHAAPYLIVEDETGTPVFDSDGGEAFERIIQFERELVAPPVGAFYRTYEKGGQAYDLECVNKFDPKLLKLIVTETPRGSLIVGARYRGDPLEEIHCLDRSWRDDTVEMFA